jgi:hypothetical protein
MHPTTQGRFAYTEDCRRLGDGVLSHLPQPLLHCPMPALLRAVAGSVCEGRHIWPETLLSS